MSTHKQDDKKVTPESLLADLERQGTPPDQLDWIRRYMAGEVGRDTVFRSHNMPTRREKPKAPPRVFCWNVEPGPGGVIQSDDERRNAAADAAFEDFPTISEM